MGRTEPEIERLYNLITVIDNCLDNDHKSPGDYDKVKNQEQLWKNTEERAHRNKNKGEKDLIYKIARIISVNSGNFGDRDYKIASALQKKNNLSNVLSHLKSRYTSIKDNRSKKDDTSDVMRGLRRIDPANAIDATIVDQVPVKSGDKHIEILNSCIEVLEQSGDDKASLNYSRAALQKVTAMNSMKYPERYKGDIKKILKDVVRKAEKLIKDKDL